MNRTPWIASAWMLLLSAPTGQNLCDGLVC